MPASSRTARPSKMDLRRFFINELRNNPKLIAGKQTGFQKPFQNAGPFQVLTIHLDLRSGASTLFNQCSRKNCFSRGRKVSARPTMGRSAVVICAVTSRKMRTQAR